MMNSSQADNTYLAVFRTGWERNFRVLCLTIVLTTWCLPIANAQDITWESPLTPGPNQPASLESDAPLSNDVRRQLGLALLPPEQASAESTQTSLPPAVQSSGPMEDLGQLSELLSDQAEGLTSREGIGSSIKVALLLAVLSLAPAIVLMTTCYVRVIVVLTLLKQAFGAQQLPPMQVLTALSLFLTMLVMAPVWNEVKTEAIDPYTSSESEMDWEEAWQRGVVPIKRFMAQQIEASGNTEAVAQFYRYLPDAGTLPSMIDDVPINVLLPAFLVSELKVAFLLGFQIFLPFLVLDLVVSSVTVSTGMMMLPPTMVSFPLKLILFVMVDGWNLVIGMLLQSFAPFS